jgi:hypothetical protein
VKNLLDEYETLSNRWSDVELLFDDKRQRYIAVRVGWQNHRRIHRCLIHINIVDETVVIQANNTEDDLRDTLVAMGVPDESIMLGFIPPDVRALFKETPEFEEQLELA